MMNLDEFRLGRSGVPLHDADELPECCGRCPYLIVEEFTVCFIDDPFYYYCAYNWPNMLERSEPPCLAAGPC